MKTPTAIGFAFAIIGTMGGGATAAFSEEGEVGTVDWGHGVAIIERVACGMSGDSFIMRAYGDDFSLRVAFSTEGDERSADFSEASSTEIRFDADHDYARASFMRLRSQGEMGEIDADGTEANGSLHLRAANIEAMDLYADGLEVSYAFQCTEEAH